MIEWRPVVGYEGMYEVSDDGQVRSLDRVIMTRNRWGECPKTLTSQLIKPFTNKQGYARVVLSDGGNSRKHCVHVLVAAAFIGNRPEGLQVCHNDGDNSNNCPDNLRYDTASANVKDCVRHGNQGQRRKTHCPQGHRYDEANTAWVRTPSGVGRQCYECKRVRQRAYVAKRKQGAAL